MDKLNLIEKEALTNQEKEVYRTLRTNIEFTGVENQVIAVTSCMPDDGKTMVSFQIVSAFVFYGVACLIVGQGMVYINMEGIGSMFYVNRSMFLA